MYAETTLTCAIKNFAYIFKHFEPETIKNDIVM